MRSNLDENAAQTAWIDDASRCLEFGCSEFFFLQAALNACVMDVRRRSIISNWMCSEAGRHRCRRRSFGYLVGYFRIAMGRQTAAQQQHKITIISLLLIVLGHHGCRHFSHRPTLYDRNFCFILCTVDTELSRIFYFVPIPLYIEIR